MSVKGLAPGDDDNDDGDLLNGLFSLLCYMLVCIYDNISVYDNNVMI